MFHNKDTFSLWQWLAPRPTPKLEGYPLSVVHDCLFNIFAATLHIEGRSSICNSRTRHAVVTGTHLQHGTYITLGYLNLQVTRSIQGKRTPLRESSLLLACASQRCKLNWHNGLLSSPVGLLTSTSAPPIPTVHSTATQGS
jgi:hypothetical protein